MDERKRKISSLGEVEGRRCSKRPRRPTYKLQASLDHLSSQASSLETVITETNEAKIIQQACRTMEAKGGHGLVVTIGPNGLQWFGSGLGEQFGMQHMDFFLKFQTYCQENSTKNTKGNSKVEPLKDDNGTKPKKLRGKKAAEERPIPKKTKKLKYSVKETKDKQSDIIKEATTAANIPSESMKSKRETDIVNDTIDIINGTGGVELELENEIAVNERTEVADISINDEVMEELNDIIKAAADGHDDDTCMDEDVIDENVADISFNIEEMDTAIDKDTDIEETIKAETPSKSIKKMEQRQEKRKALQEEINIKKEALLKEVVAVLKTQENGDVAVVKDILRKRYNQDSGSIYSVSDFNYGDYQCSKCGYRFIWKSHLEIHCNKYPYCYPDEPFEVTDEEALQEEVTFVPADTDVEITSSLQSLYDIQSQNVSLYTCLVCEKKISTLDRFKQHLIQCHVSFKLYKCNICGQSFQTELLLSNHLKQHFNHPYECQSCSWRFSKPQHLEKHKENGCGHISLLDNSVTKSSHVTTEYKCSACKLEVSGLQEFQHHLQIQHPDGQGGFECKTCRHISPRLHLYEEHVRQHLGKHACPFCPKFFTSVDRLNSHVHDHKAQLMDMICYVCGLSFTSKRKLDNHIRAHTGETPYTCTEKGCSKSFRTYDSWTQHKWTHCGHNYVCDICGRSFKSPGALSYHHRNHTADRWSCDYCSEKFSTLFSFKRHLVKQHVDKREEIAQRRGIKIFKCELCCTYYHESDDFKLHMNNKHNGISSYKCKYCAKTFANSSNLKVHLEGHEGFQRLKCGQCSRKFKTQDGLDKHFERKHSINFYQNGQ